MAIRFVDKPDERPRKPTKPADTRAPAPRVSITGEAEATMADATPPREEAPGSHTEARAEGEARFATPIEAAAPVNPDASSELPFVDLPRAEKGARKTRVPKPKASPGSDKPSLS